MARIAIDPELWRKVRVRAFETGTTGAAIVNEALEAFLDAPADVAAVPRRRKPETHNDVGAAAPEAPPTQEDPWKALAPPPSLIGRTITDVEEAKQVVAALPSVRPVPKPTSRKPSRSRRPSRSATIDPEP